MITFPSAVEALRLYEQLLLIRAYENAIVAGSTEGRIPGTCTSVGQEAAAVGAVNALNADDLILTNHRSAGHLLARGADPGRMLAEVMGRRDGYCKGKSGSLHISVKELGVVLTTTIVGGELSLAYQPQIAIVSRRLLGVEALLRGEPAPAEDFARRVRDSDFGRRFVAGTWPNLPLADLDLAAHVDRFDFAMPVAREGEHLVIR